MIQEERPAKRTEEGQSNCELLLGSQKVCTALSWLTVACKPGHLSKAAPDVPTFNLDLLRQKSKQLKQELAETWSKQAAAATVTVMDFDSQSEVVLTAVRMSFVSTGLCFCICK